MKRQKHARKYGLAATMVDRPKTTRQARQSISVKTDDTGIKIDLAGQPAVLLQDGEPEVVESAELDDESTDEEPDEDGTDDE